MQFPTVSRIPGPEVRLARRGLALGLAIAVALFAGQTIASPATQEPPTPIAHAHAEATVAPAGHAHAAAGDAHAAHGHATGANQVPPTGQRWATDAPLQDGMGRIRQAVTALEHYQHGHLDQTQAINATGLIDTAVQDMIANCKLEPDADAALHVLIAKFITGADAVRSGRDVSGSITSMQDALAQYPTQFDDPTWDVNPED